MSAKALREPERTCVGCRVRAGKRDLMRLVRGPDGSVRFDPTGKGPGRGAYVHRDEQCLRLAIRGGTLGRALRVPLDAAEVGRLVEVLIESPGESV